MTHYTARRLPTYAGAAGWNAILGPQAAYPTLDRDGQADFVVVGAGFAGLSAARRLRQLAPQARIVVLEAGRIAEGASGRNSGFMIDLPHELNSDDYVGAGDDRAVITLNRHAIAFARHAAEEYGIDRNYFDPAGKVNGAASPAAHAHNESYARHLASLSEPSEMLDAKAMHQLTGSRHYVSGLFTPGTVMLQPAGYIRGLAAGLSAQDVGIFEKSPVVAFEKSGSGWRVRTPEGAITTDKIILSVNGHLESFGFYPRRLLHLFLYAVMTPELDAGTLNALGGAPRWGITPSNPMGTTVRRIDSAQGGNRIITRTCATVQPDAVPSERQLQRARKVMQAKFEARFPQLAGLEMEHAWVGHLCLSLNGVAVMRPVEDGVYSACVDNGLGTTRGTLTGIGAAELACSQTSPVTAHFTAEDMPRRLPPSPFQELGANAFLRWKEWVARHE